MKNTAKVARPPVAVHGYSTMQRRPFHLLLSAEERATLDTIARREGCSIADVLRRLARAEVRRAQQEDAGIALAIAPAPRVRAT